MFILASWKIVLLNEDQKLAAGTINGNLSEHNRKYHALRGMG